jgi:hypothetical protein
LQEQSSYSHFAKLGLSTLVGQHFDELVNFICSQLLKGNFDLYFSDIFE